MKATSRIFAVTVARLEVAACRIERVSAQLTRRRLRARFAKLKKEIAAVDGTPWALPSVSRTTWYVAARVAIGGIRLRDLSFSKQLEMWDATLAAGSP